MKKVIFTLAVAISGFFAQASTAENATPSSTVNYAIENLELKDNMIATETPLNDDEMVAMKVKYLGLYHVYINGHYIGLRHVYLITKD